VIYDVEQVMNAATRPSSMIKDSLSLVFLLGWICISTGS
jgi:hypothetical protein